MNRQAGNEGRNMTEQVRELLDRLDVAQVLSRYSYGWDTRDFDLVAACFLPDAVIRYSSLPDFPGGFADFFSLECKNIVQLASTQHLISNLHIAVDGDRAECSSYIQATHYAENGDNWTTGGRYDDVMVRTESGWRISERTFTRQWIRDEQGLSRRFLAN